MSCHRVCVLKRGRERYAKVTIVTRARACTQTLCYAGFPQLQPQTTSVKQTKVRSGSSSCLTTRPSSYTEDSSDRVEAGKRIGQEAGHRWNGRAAQPFSGVFSRLVYVSDNVIRSLQTSGHVTLNAASQKTRGGKEERGICQLLFHDLTWGIFPFQNQIIHQSRTCESIDQISTRKVDTIDCGIAMATIRPPNKNIRNGVVVVVVVVVDDPSFIRRLKGKN